MACTLAHSFIMAMRENLAVLLGAKGIVLVREYRDRLAARLSGDAISLNTPVRSLHN